MSKKKKRNRGAARVPTNHDVRIPSHCKADRGWNCNSCGIADNFNYKTQCRRCGISYEYQLKLGLHSASPIRGAVQQQQRQQQQQEAKTIAGAGVGTNGKGGLTGKGKGKASFGGCDNGKDVEEAMQDDSKAPSMVDCLVARLAAVVAVIATYEQGAACPLLKVQLEAKAMLEKDLEKAREHARSLKPVATRRRELEQQADVVAGKLAANKTKLAAAMAEADKLQQFVRQQEERSLKLQEELRALALKEAETLGADLSGGDDGDATEEEAALEARLEYLRKRRRGSREAQLGAKLYDIGDHAGRNLFGATVPAWPDEEHLCAERRARSASPGRAKPKTTQRKLFGA